MIFSEDTFWCHISKNLHQGCSPCCALSLIEHLQNNVYFSLVRTCPGASQKVHSAVCFEASENRASISRPCKKNLKMLRYHSCKAEHFFTAEQTSQSWVRPLVCKQYSIVLPYVNRYHNVKICTRREALFVQQPRFSVYDSFRIHWQWVSAFYWVFRNLSKSKASRACRNEQCSSLQTATTYWKCGDL